MDRYRRPSQSSYARGTWWLAHGIELIGAVGGFVSGMLLLMLAIAIAPNSDLGWLPWVMTLVGGLSLRAVIRRQLPKR